MTRYYGRAVFRGVVDHAKVNPRWRLSADPGSVSLDDLVGCDGAVVQVQSSELRHTLSRLGIPVVNVSGSRWDDPLPQVAVDDRAVGRLAAEHLLERGFRRFAFVSTGPLIGYAQRRFDGFRETLAARGVDCDLHVSSSEELRDGERGAAVLAAIGQWMRGRSRPLGVFAPADSVARTCIEAATQAGLAVPEEVAIVGVDDDLMICETSDPPLTSVAIPAQRIGREAARRLDWLLQGQAVPPQLLLPPIGVVVRRSTDTFAVEDPAVRRALLYLAEHAAAPIALDDAARAARVPRRTLERRFRKHVGCSLHQKLIQLRVDRARRLLVQTDEPMSVVAAAAGFSDQKKLATHFKAQTGSTPTQHRRDHRER